MAVELVMPRLSDVMTEGTVAGWYVHDGTAVGAGQPLAAIATPHGTQPYVAPEAGVVRILVPAGATLAVGEPLGLLDDLPAVPPPPRQPAPQRSPAWGPGGAPSVPPAPPGELAPVIPAAAPSQDDEEPATTEFAAITPPQEPADEPDPAPEPIAGPPTLPPRPPEQRPTAGTQQRIAASPVARKLAAELGIELATLKGSGPDGRIVKADVQAAAASGAARPPIAPEATPRTASDFVPPAPSVAAPAEAPEPDPAPASPEPAAPSAAAAAPHAGAPSQPEPAPAAPHEPEPADEPDPAPTDAAPPEPADEPASAATEEPAAEPEPEPAATSATPPAPADPATGPTPDPAGYVDTTPTTPTVAGGGKGEATVVEPTRAQQTLARRVAESRATIPSYDVTVEVDARPLLELREELAQTRSDLAALSLNDLVVKAAALALREHPSLNGVYRDGRIEQFPRINVGLATESGGALLVPVVLDADKQSLAQLAERTSELLKKAADGALRPADLASGTFTVSNLGTHGVDEFTAIILPGQSALLTVGRIAERPVVSNGAVVAGHTLRLTLTVDHRAVYGVEAATFLARVRRLLERPAGLLV